jgi:hypothetical protein
MNKTYFVLFAVFISVVAGFFVTSVYFKKQNEETSTQIVEFVQVTMDSFLSSHDTDYFRQHCSQAYNAILKDSDLAQYLRLLNYLGTYKQIIAIQSDTENLMTRSDSVDVIFYLVVETGFENATANLLLELVMEADSWKINRFGLQAQALTI